MASYSVFSPFLLLLISSAFLTCDSSRRGEPVARAPTSFSFDFFRSSNKTFASQIALYGRAASAADHRAVTIAAPGRITYKKPVVFFGRSPGFSTYFSFSLSASDNASAADLAFFLTPTNAKIDYSPSVLSVHFVASGAPKANNLSACYIKIDVSDVVVAKSSSNVSLLSGGEKLHSWIDYNGTCNRLEIRLGKSSVHKAAMPVFSYPIDLSNVLWRKPMLVGFSSVSAAAAAAAAAANSSQNCSLYSWAFQAKHGPPYLMHSQPLDPSSFFVTPPHKAVAPPANDVRRSYPWGIAMALVFAAVCGAMVTFFMLFVWFAVVARRSIAPVEYPVHPSDVVYEKIVLVAVKDDAAGEKK